MYRIALRRMLTRQSPAGSPCRPRAAPRARPRAPAATATPGPLRTAQRRRKPCGRSLHGWRGASGAAGRSLSARMTGKLELRGERGRMNAFAKRNFSVTGPVRRVTDIGVGTVLFRPSQARSQTHDWHEDAQRVDLPVVWRVFTHAPTAYVSERETAGEVTAYVLSSPGLSDSRDSDAR